VFTQVLFSPEPVVLLRRAEAAALADLADGLQLTARALERDDDTLAEPAMASLRDLRDRMAELRRINRRRLAPSVRELAAAIGDLARAPGDRPSRQRAADRALELARSTPGSPTRGCSRPACRRGRTVTLPHLRHL
jgi:hypothetical protein